MPHFFRPPADALPPAKVRCTSLRAEPFSDGKRIRIYLDLTPFQQPPDIFVTLSDLTGAEIARAHLIGVINSRLTIIMHPRNFSKQSYTLTATVDYPELGISNQSSTIFDLS